MNLNYNMVQTSTAPPPTDEAQAGTAKGDEKDVFEQALALSDKHFSTKTNKLMERHRFLQRHQMPGEAFEAHAAALHELCAGCDFGEATDKDVLDQLLEGAASQHVRERLLFGGTSLTINRLIDTGRLIEHTQRELKELSGDLIVQRVVEKFESGSGSVLPLWFKWTSPEGEGIPG